MKLIKTHTDSTGKKVAKVHHDQVWQEYRVSFHTDGKHHKDSDYHTDDKDDAHSTAKHWLKEEVQIDEISNKTLGSYIKKSSENRAALGRKWTRDKADGKSFDDTFKTLRKIVNRRKGISTATDKLTKEESEQIDENVLGSHDSNVQIKISKGKDKVTKKPTRHVDMHGNGEKIRLISSVNNDWDHKKIIDHLKSTHGSKLNGFKWNVQEEVNQIDEISKKTLGSYIAKSADSLELNAWKTGYTEKDNPEWAKRTNKKSQNRLKGIKRAKDRLTKEEVINNTIEKFFNKDRRTIEERITETLSNYSPSIQEQILELFSNLNEDNQRILYLTIKEENGINEVMDFIISNKE